MSCMRRGYYISQLDIRFYVLPQGYSTIFMNTTTKVNDFVPLGITNLSDKQ